VIKSWVFEKITATARTTQHLLFIQHSQDNGGILDDYPALFIKSVYSGEVDPLIPGQADPSARGLLVKV
jgi:hypothetical protein